MALITCRELCLGYDGQEILHNLNFSVDKGDYLCIVGENGSGKSTLMRTLLGLQQPLHGSITLSEGLTHRQIGYLPQQTIVQRDFPATVREIVLSGFQGRAGLARALCATERVLLLDEPVSGLDPQVTAEMYALIRQLNREGVTIIMISHDIHAAMTYASRILHIGDEIFFGTPQDYRRSGAAKGFFGKEARA